MMHSCGGCSQGHVMGTCTCGMFHTTQPNSYSMFFSMPTHNNNPYEYDDYHETDVYPFTPSPSAVDCTLSLGTPSTRLTEDEDRRNRRSSVNKNFGTKTTRGSSNNGGNSNNNNDSLLARRCANCDTTSTPLWRNGPRGPKSLCNACGIRFKKEERRAAAATTTAAAASGYGNSWYAAQSQIGGELRFMDDSDRDSENGIPNFLSWRLNVNY